MKKNLLLLIIMLFLLTSCGLGGGKAKNSAESAKKEFVLPQIPAIYATQLEQMDYLANHYWDKFDFTDTTYIDLSEVTEQALANFLHLLNGLPRASGTKAMNKLLKGAEADSSMFAYVTELLDKYLYEPNSPMLNEELYTIALRYIIASSNVEELNKLRPRAQLEMTLKNRVGESAADFNFTTRAGAKMRLSEVRAPYVLIYFNNPDCTACAEVTGHLTNSDIISSLVEAGTLKIIALYPDEEEVGRWRENNHGIPSNWIDAYDPSFKIRGDRLYDLRAIPALYLVDKNKKVIIKDAPTAHAIEAYFAK